MARSGSSETGYARASADMKRRTTRTCPRTTGKIGRSPVRLAEEFIGMGAFVGATAIVLGVALLLFRKEFARQSVEFQNNVWRFRFGEREVFITEVIAVMVALGFLAFGVGAVVGLARFAP